jgi:small multidrug resistance family-3 protein
MDWLPAAPVLRALLLFGLAGLAEIGGGYLVWRWLRADGVIWFAVAGAVVLFLYGVVHTFQDEVRFSRIYAAYGAMFVVLALFWGWWLDGTRPDRYDLLGAAIVSAGVGVIFFSPRGGA